ncbi:anti-CBASS protein Acb1 family protein [Pelagibius sp.]|uniref:anti-CBASS protein Acb1 family protein n=1 Tax=Pelagibius sp. TaxID=1931238 RepID=UPI003BB1B4D7
MTKLPPLLNAIATRSLGAMFPGFFPGHKHNLYRDFGYPETLEFKQFFDMYRRNGLANAAIDKTVLKVWQDNPSLREREGSDEETQLERDIRQRFDDLRVWQRLAEAGRRSMVGAYAGVILRVADSKQFQEPVDTVSGGIDGLVEIIPAWEGQLTVGQWDTDQTSETYGQPTMFQFNEAAVEGEIQHGNARTFQLHPDRVIVWSDDGTIHGRSMLEPGYNDLVTLEKVSGAGGEGFWKNAKSAPVLEVDKEADIRRMAQAMGVSEEDVRDKLDEHVESWQKGFDQLLMLQGMEAKTLGVTLISPEHFFRIALESFAASFGIPLKILVGSQTGERASTEDAAEWAHTCMARRSNVVRPGIMEFVNRLERFRILPERDWFLAWTDLTESSMAEKVERADKMAGVNQKMNATGELVFTGEEIRAAVDLEPLSDADRFGEDDEEDHAAALPPPVEE